MPPVSRFGGGNRAAKKQGVIDKPKSFFEKFFGAGGSFNANEPKTMNYTDITSNQPLMQVAKDNATYRERSKTIY